MNQERISLLWEREGSETLMLLTRVRADFMFNDMAEASRFFEDLFNQANGNNKARFRPELTIVPSPMVSLVLCQDCGLEALNGYVAGDRCVRQDNRGKVCGGRLDEEKSTPSQPQPEPSHPQAPQPTERLVPRFPNPKV